MTLMDCLISSNFLALSLIRCLSSDLFLPRLVCVNKTRTERKSIPMQLHTAEMQKVGEAVMSCQGQTHQRSSNTGVHKGASPSSSSTRDQRKRCRVTCGCSRRKPSTRRRGRCGSRRPADVRVSCRSCLPS